MKVLFVFVITMLACIGLLSICEYAFDGIIDSFDMRRVFGCATIGATLGTIVFAIIYYLSLVKQQ